MPPSAHNSDEPRTRELTPPTTTGPSSQAGVSSVPRSPTTPVDEGEVTVPPLPQTLPPQPALPRFFGAYELLERLGKGGMGVVYRARDLSLGREVALKMLRGGPFEDEHGVARFFLEARAAARLDHPHIVPVYEVDEHDGQHYYTMRLLSQSVAQERERFAGDPRAAVELMEKVARAVHFAHEHGVLHRDLKPGNILLDDQGEPLVSDFGLAKMLDIGLELTQSGVPVGTIPYMPPEQAAGRKDLIAAHSDVWSLGVTLYELLTGVRPFVGDSQEQILSQIKSSDPTPPRKLQPKLDRDLETICLKCLEKEPSRRYATAEALAEDLRRWWAGEGIAGRSVGWLVHRWRKKLARGRGLVAGLCLIAATAVAIGVIWNPTPTVDKTWKSHEAQLARGEALTLVGLNELPKVHRWRLTSGGLEPSRAEGMGISVHCFELGLLELLACVPIESYILRAEIHHAQADEDGQVGVFFGYHEKDQNVTRPHHCFFKLAFTDQWKKVPDTTVSEDVVMPTDGRLELTIRHVEAAAAYRQYSTGVQLSYPIPIRKPHELLWRQLEVRVTPQRIGVTWDGRPLRDAPRVDLANRAEALVRGYAELNAQEDFATNGAVGLYVFRSRANVRNFIVTPLEEK